MSGRLKLKSIYPTFDEFKTYCQNVVGEFYPQIIDMIGFGDIVSEMNRYVYLPIYRQFKNATCRYLPTEEGIEAFNNQFANQLEEVIFDFLIYTSTNISYFNEAYNNVGQNLEQGVATFNNPISQDIKNTKSNTVIADGATSQSVNLMIYNGKTSWRKAFSSYYTPQRKAELIDRFRWLFISFYVGNEEGVTLVELTEALSMADGDMIITPEEAEILRKVIIEKPETLIPENIKKGVNIGGVIGTLEGGSEMIKNTYEVETNNISIDLSSYVNGVKFIINNDNELSNFMFNNRDNMMKVKIKTQTVIPEIEASVTYEYVFTKTSCEDFIGVVSGVSQIGQIQLVFGGKGTIAINSNDNIILGQVGDYVYNPEASEHFFRFSAINTYLGEQDGMTFSLIGFTIEAYSL